ncbi:MAG: LysM peptidoglycan-binding domain-containing protein [Coriobacteriia bacterium]|nr:LysM peptidoglycan-binding domain-containing protein [Coriobacteriia bacterium]MBN2841353.1 LysM peptidoglycan-binding domain-containing protein [Coriobacteriia bacterium]
MSATLVYQAHLTDPGTRSCVIRTEIPGRPDRRNLDLTRPRASRAGQKTPDPARVLARVLYALLLVAAAAAITASVTAHPERPVPVAWSSVTVGPSATLWTIAQANPVEGLSTAETVALIKDSNRLDSAIIAPGQTLLVPARGVTGLAVASP